MEQFEHEKTTAQRNAARTTLRRSTEESQLKDAELNKMRTAISEKQRQADENEAKMRAISERRRQTDENEAKLKLAIAEWKRAAEVANLERMHSERRLQNLEQKLDAAQRETGEQAKRNSQLVRQRQMDLESAEMVKLQTITAGDRLAASTEVVTDEELRQQRLAQLNVSDDMSGLSELEKEIENAQIRQAKVDSMHQKQQEIETVEMIEKKRSPIASWHTRDRIEHEGAETRIKARRVDMDEVQNSRHVNDGINRDA
jgi:hypothetical protein